MQRDTRATVLFIIIGVLLLLASYLTEKPVTAMKFLSTALFNVAFVLLTVGILNPFWRLMGGEPLSVQIESLASTINNMRSSVQLLSDSRDSGLKRLLPLSSGLGAPDWMQRLRSAQRSVDLMGYTLHVWTRSASFEDDVLDLVRRGVAVRLLFMDPANPHLEALINSDQIRAANLPIVEGELAGILNVVKSLEKRAAQIPSPKGSFDFRATQKGMIVNQISRFDDEVRVVDYLWSVVASSSPLIVIQDEDSPLYYTYTKEFESLWDLNKPTIACENPNQPVVD